MLKLMTLMTEKPLLGCSEFSKARGVHTDTGQLHSRSTIVEIFSLRRGPILMIFTQTTPSFYILG